MKRGEIQSTELDSLIAEVSLILEGPGRREVSTACLASAYRDPIRNDEELQARMALIDELYSHADSESHTAARFAEMVTDRVYEYEQETVLAPYSCQSLATVRERMADPQRVKVSLNDL
ncbi:hypothetical protein ACIPZF_23295 [Pseudomonas sp. NPDC089752]|uniref:hypothetical protein n=1 Tax=Pseudomonas sp. NPDC089752 TaxID=3364472 RepID=UPI00381190D1